MSIYAKTSIEKFCESLSKLVKKINDYNTKYKIERNNREI